MYGRQDSLEQGHNKENGYSLPTPSTIVESIHQDVANPTSFLSGFGHQLGDEKGVESDLHVQPTPRLVSHAETVALNDVDGHAHVSGENEILGMGPPVDFQIGTPQQQRGRSPVEREGVNHMHSHDGYSRPHNSLDMQQTVVQSAISDTERRELEHKIKVRTFTGH